MLEEGWDSFGLHRGRGLALQGASRSKEGAKAFDEFWKNVMEIFKKLSKYCIQFSLLCIVESPMASLVVASKYSYKM